MFVLTVQMAFEQTLGKLKAFYSYISCLLSKSELIIFFLTNDSNINGNKLIL